MTREEFDRRLAEIERRFSHRSGEPRPRREELDAAFAALEALTMQESTQADRSRMRAVEAVGAMLRRTYAMQNLPVPELG
jgi:hypothetical protein